METYSAFLLAVILPVVHEPGVAEDILQETFLQVYLSLSGYVGGSFKHWLARIATHKAIDWHRQNRRRPPETLVENWEEVNGLMADPDPPVEEEVIRREALNRLRGLCRQLPEDYQRTLNGFYLEGKSYKELAVAEGITVKTVQSRLYRARNMLRAQWEEGKYGPL